VVGVDDPHVVDRATASVAGSPGYAATRARGVYLEPAHLDDANEVDDVGVGVRDRRALRGIACVQGVGANYQVGRLADQALVRAEVEPAGVVARPLVHEHGLVGDRLRLGRAELVERIARGARVAGLGGVVK
jgi:hypothetical protein